MPPHAVGIGTGVGSGTGSGSGVGGTSTGGSGIGAGGVAKLTLTVPFAVLAVESASQTFICRLSPPVLSLDTVYVVPNVAVKNVTNTPFFNIFKTGLLPANDTTLTT